MLHINNPIASNKVAKTKTAKLNSKHTQTTALLHTYRRANVSMSVSLVRRKSAEKTFVSEQAQASAITNKFDYGGGQAKQKVQQTAEQKVEQEQKNKVNK